MNFESLADVATTTGLLITFFGLLIFYFGKIILKSRKETTKDITSESIHGIFFLADYLLIPGLIVYVALLITLEYIFPLVLYGQAVSFLELFKLIIGALLISAQYGIFTYYSNRTKKVEGTPRGIDYLFSIYIIGATLVFIKMGNWFYLISSLIFSFLIYTYMATRDHFRNFNNNNNGKLLEIKIEEAGKIKTIKAKIQRMGNEFIDVIIDKKEVAINKNNIISIKQ